ncbi:caspase-8-like [Micropterus salmoides]|uniref:caspase-8-like n=1 Tax=Micropterus salmoides TaxID=27706 RepID=UPI0018EDAD68|nr:caspase-8-like [Micropterus salmoides]
MDPLTLKLFHIDEGLRSSEVAALCFLCRDVVNRKRLEGIRNAQGLFFRLKEKCLLDNEFFLSQLLSTIHRPDLLRLLETDSRQPEEPVANPVLSDYRVMLFQIYEGMTQANFEKMKIHLSKKLGTRHVQTCTTALDVFSEMEKIDLLSNTNLHELHTVLQELDENLALTVERYVKAATQPHPSCVNVDYQTEYYTMNHNPHGLCVVINNEEFQGTQLKDRKGTHEDEKALHKVFTHLGFKVMVHNNLTAEAMRLVLKELSRRNFFADDALVVCVLSHGEKGCVYGTDEKEVSLQELTQLFISERAPTLAGKPKLFFIQACQGSSYQRGCMPCPPMLRQEGGDKEVEEDAGPAYGKMVTLGADFVLGMATVSECKSFRNTSTGSIYIQELCKQLMRSAQSSEDMFIVLTHVNMEVSKGQYLKYKQMPEIIYTLTKKLVLSV